MGGGIPSAVVPTKNKVVVTCLFPSNLHPSNTAAFCKVFWFDMPIEICNCIPIYFHTIILQDCLN